MQTFFKVSGHNEICMYFLLAHDQMLWSLVFYDGLALRKIAGFLLGASVSHRQSRRSWLSIQVVSSCCLLAGRVSLQTMGLSLCLTGLSGVNQGA